MLEHSLTSAGFLSMVTYGIVSVPLYIATIVIVIRTKTLKGSFYNIYIASGIANIVMYLNKFLSVRLPLFTCGDCALQAFFRDKSYFWLTPVVFCHWHFNYTQFWLTSLMALDRFVIIVLANVVVKYWKKIYVWIIVFLYVSPLIFSINVLKTTPMYEWYNETDNFRYTILDGDLYFLYNTIFAIMLISCVISFVFNFAVYCKFRCGKLKIPGYQRTIEMKLFINCVMDALVQFSCGVVTGLQAYMRSTDPEVYDSSRVALCYVGDLMTIVPPVILMITCVDVREGIYGLFRRKRVTVTSQIETSNNAFIPRPSISSLR